MRLIGFAALLLSLAVSESASSQTPRSECTVKNIKVNGTVHQSCAAPKQRDHFYVGDDDIGYGLGAKVSSDGKSIKFDRVHFDISGVFVDEIRYRQYNLDCPTSGPLNQKATSGPVHATFAAVTCTVLTGAGD